MSEPAGGRIEFLRTLRSVRDYLADPVPPAALDDVLKVGRWSGSASNRQTWEIVIVRDPAAKQKLGEWGAGPAAKAALALVIVTPGDVERAELEMFDDGRLAERLLLAAHAHGLGSCVAFLKGEGPANTKALLGIPPERRVRSVVAIGVTDQAARAARPKNPQPRKPIGELVHWDRF